MSWYWNLGVLCLLPTYRKHRCVGYGGGSRSEKKARVRSHARKHFRSTRSVCVEVLPKHVQTHCHVMQCQLGVVRSPSSSFSKMVADKLMQRRFAIKHLQHLKNNRPSFFQYFLRDVDFFCLLGLANFNYEHCSHFSSLHCNVLMQYATRLH